MGPLDRANAKEYFVIIANNETQTFHIDGPVKSDQSLINKVLSAQKEGKDITYNTVAGPCIANEALREAQNTYQNFEMVKSVFAIKQVKLDTSKGKASWDPA